MKEKSEHIHKIMRFRNVFLIPSYCTGIESLATQCPIHTILHPSISLHSIPSRDLLLIHKHEKTCILCISSARYRSVQFNSAQPMPCPCTASKVKKQKKIYTPSLQAWRMQAAVSSSHAGLATGLTVSNGAA